MKRPEWIDGVYALLIKATGAPMKYVIFEQDGFESAVMVPDQLLHKLATHPEVVTKMQLKIVSAGWCEMLNGNVRCYGDSTTLNLRARKEDAEIVNQTLWLNKMARLEVGCSKPGCGIPDGRP